MTTLHFRGMFRGRYFGRLPLREIDVRLSCLSGWAQVAVESKFVCAAPTADGSSLLIAPDNIQSKESVSFWFRTGCIVVVRNHCQKTIFLNCGTRNTWKKCVAERQSFPSGKYCERSVAGLPKLHRRSSSCSEAARSSCSSRNHRRTASSAWTN